MYTVKELIEALQQCPEDYAVLAGELLTELPQIEAVGIDHAQKVVELFTEE